MLRLFHHGNSINNIMKPSNPTLLIVTLFLHISLGIISFSSGVDGVWSRVDSRLQLLQPQSNSNRRVSIQNTRQTANQIGTQTGRWMPITTTRNTASRHVTPRNTNTNTFNARNHLYCPVSAGLFPYPHDCNKYIQCNFGKGLLRSCGPGTVFNPAIKACDWPHAVACPPVTSSLRPQIPHQGRENQREENRRWGDGNRVRGNSASQGNSKIPGNNPSPGQRNWHIPPGHRNHLSTPAQRNQPTPPDQVTLIQINRHSPPGHRNQQIPPGHRNHPSTTAQRNQPIRPSQTTSVQSNHHIPPGHMKKVTPLGRTVSPGETNTPGRAIGAVSTLTGAVSNVGKSIKIKGKKVMYKDGLDRKNVLCPRPDGLFPYPKDCSRFVNCWRGHPHLQQCSPGTLFHAGKGICDFAAKTVCAKAKSSASPDPITHVVPPPSGQRIRLRGSNVPWAGYVQVSDVAGVWSLVCDEEGEWSQEEADVVCRSLGFTRGAEPSSKGAVFGLPPGQTTSVVSVRCQGHEEHLDECQIVQEEREDMERTVVGVHCIRNWVSECEVGGVRWGDKCYYVQTTSTTTTHEHARDQCASMGARLLSITSQAESDFVSDMLSSMVGDSPGFHTGAVRTQVFETTLWLWQNTSILPSTTLPYSNWWPGWKVAERRGHERGDEEGEMKGSKCVVLRETFPISLGEETQGKAPAEYFFWELADCDEKLHYVCETDKLEIGCVLDRGSNYTGAARVSVRGEECLAWNHPSLQHKVKDLLLSPHHLLGNYCANPDGDDLPWCFTSAGRAIVCDIPRCERQTVLEIECGADKFQCSSGECVNGVWYCDGHEDCEDGSDERNCHDYSESFSKRMDSRMLGREVEKWLNTLKTTCAARCVQAKNFVCMSFNYQQSTETCILSDTNVGRSGGLERERGWEYYEMKTLALDCRGKFVCGDGQCFDATKQCNGRRDCKDGTDEDGCVEKIDFQVRLANGSTPSEGRIEVKVSGRWGGVCDDMWDVLEGDVLCQSLGFPLGAKEVFLHSHFGSGGLEYLMDDLNCKGTEGSLAECDFGGWGVHDCVAFKEMAGVRCFTEDDECEKGQWRCGNGRCVQLKYLCDTVDDCRDESDEERAMCQSSVEVRLVGEEPGRGAHNSLDGDGSEVFAGRVEVRYLGMWGSVCDDDFRLEEGHVFCRMMGWKRATHVYKNNTFGPGSGLIWLDDVQCLGYENSVHDCQHTQWGENNCDHNEDVGIRCTNNEKDAHSIIHDIDRDVATTPATVLPATCGKRLVEDDPLAPILERPKIVDGHVPPPGSHPWMVAIYVRTKTGSKHTCGGCVLSEDIVLTAAHCVNRFPPHTYILRIGDFNTEVDEEEQQEHKVSSIAIHPQFDKGPYLNNDVALVRVQRKNGRGIQFGNHVQPLCLVSSKWNYPSYLNCTVAGWGSLGIAQGYSNVLHSALLPILPKSTCQADHVYGPVRLTAGMYCAGYLEGGVDTCQGDSGGPMVCVVEGRHTVVGITSWGHGCARPNKPGVYTRLTHYLSWLYSNLR